MTTAIDLSKREAALVALSDVDLVEHIYLLVQEIDSDVVSDEFYWYLTEAFERFAPDAEWENRARSLRTEFKPENRRLELEASRAAMAARATARWMARSVDDV